MNTPNNIIQFPKKPKTTPSHEIISARERKKIAVPVSLVSVLVMAFLTNNFLNPMGSGKSELSSSSGRSIASTGPSLVNHIENHELLKQIARGAARGPASIGKSPSSAEQVLYGQFEGAYRVTFDGGRIAAADLSENATPVYLTDARGFLAQLQSHLAVDFEGIRSKPTESADGTEVFELLGADQSPVGQASFRLDVHGRLISMKIEKNLPISQ